MDETRASILIAQADGVDQLALSPLLIQEGYQVEQTYDARLFLTEYDRVTPNLILLDSALPGGDAFTLCARLHAGSSVPILMLTPSDEETIERAYRAGAADVLV